MMINSAVTSCLLPTAVRSQLLPVEAPVAAAPSPQAHWVPSAAVTCWHPANHGSEFPSAALTWIYSAHMHPYLLYSQHNEHARAFKAGSGTVQTTASQRFLPTVPENKKCSRLSLTAFSFKCDFSILSSPQASKKWCINMNSKEISKLCQ